MASQGSKGSPVAATVLYQDRSTAVSISEKREDELWLTMRDLEDAAGWEVKAEGVCRESICVPLPVDRQDSFIREIDGNRRLDLAEFARLIEQPYAHDDTHHVWYFGPAGWEWKERLASQQAPDFTLPDFEGKPHSLADYRGKKILLLAWASW